MESPSGVVSAAGDRQQAALDKSWQPDSCLPGMTGDIKQVARGHEPCAGTDGAS